MISRRPYNRFPLPENYPDGMAIMGNKNIYLEEEIIRFSIRHIPRIA
jgi:hypothetical protein